MCSVIADAKPSVVLRAFPMPFVWETVMPKELDSPRGKPLTSEPTRDSEPVRDLKIESFSAAFEVRLNDPARAFTNPFD